MKRSTGKGLNTLQAVLCLSLAFWSIMPALTHAPTLFDSIQDHLEMVEGHGHSHGLEEDLYWAMHGHSHDIADHDHSQVFLLAGNGHGLTPATSDASPIFPASHGPSRQFRIERPPRA